MEGTFARRMLAAGLVSPDALEACRRLGRKLAAAGLDLNLAEILVRRGLVDEPTSRAIWKAAGGDPPVDLGEPDERLDHLAVERAREAGRLAPEDLSGIEAFRSWAAGEGLRLGLAEILVRRGYLAAEDLAAPALPSPAPDGRAGSGPTSGSRRGVARTATAGTKQRLARPGTNGLESARRRSLVRVLGCIGAAVIAGLVAMLFRGRSEAAPSGTPSVDPASGTSLALELEPELDELRSRVRELARRKRFDEAVQEVESFRRSLPDEATRRKYGAEIDEVSGTIARSREEAVAPERAAPRSAVDLLADLDDWGIVNGGEGSRGDRSELLLVESGTEHLAAFETRTIDLGSCFTLGFDFRCRLSRQAGRGGVWLYFSDERGGEEGRSAFILVPRPHRPPELGFARKLPDHWSIEESADVAGGLDDGTWYRFEVDWDEASRRLVARIDGRVALELTLAAGAVLRRPWGIGIGEVQEIRVRRITLGRP